VLTGGSITLGARHVSGNIVQSNMIDGGYIVLSGYFAESNMIKNNTVRGDGIHLGFKSVNANTIVLTFVSGSSVDGISIYDGDGGVTNVIRKNTSVGNAGCDINDQSPSTSMNLWEQNRFVTKCGAATNELASERLHLREQR